MSTASSTSQPTPSPLPLRLDSAQKSSETLPLRPKKKSSFRSAKLRLQIEDLSSIGSQVFLSAVNAATVLEDAVRGVQELLYTPDSEIPGTRSITLILRSMPGVAYTTGSSLDNDHKEIHFSTDYIQHIAKDRCREEILGVIRHEVVHCWQWNGHGSAPGGLVEGIADWVRLRSGFVPPHWSRGSSDRWDAGYQHTGYFLDYLEDVYGEGSVMVINGWLYDHRYGEEMWKTLFKKPVEKLWDDYCKSLGKKPVNSQSVSSSDSHVLQRSCDESTSSDTDEIPTPEPGSPSQ
ncbi:BSP-domain-containing protein [Xylona heveae TC161]|uniref:BSP-domain-containing protein n=1 Tax=Xylona heveae (strain CBS 132557 / TC161) TaxID=1328760 RepID=A0A165HEJ6_XYLHT|nr:BSP-domain-containing protein [Xylona heveae TC161]KZF23392.1 BSP-domain-containing protein [Xylona heveae TC161]